MQLSLRPKRNNEKVQDRFLKAQKEEAQNKQKTRS